MSSEYCEDIIILNEKSIQIENIEGREKKGKLNHWLELSYTGIFLTMCTVAAATLGISPALMLTSGDALPSALTSQPSAKTNFLKEREIHFAKGRKATFRETPDMLSSIKVYEPK